MTVTVGASLSFNAFRNPCNVIDQYPLTNREGMEGCVDLVGWPIVNSLHTE